MVKNLLTTQETWFDPEPGRSPGEGSDNPLQYSWRIPWTKEPGGLYSMGLQRVKHDWMTFTSLTHQCKWTYMFSMENHIKLIVQYFKVNTKCNFWLTECVNSMLQCVCVCGWVGVFKVRMNVRSNEFTKVFVIFYII